MPEDSLDSNETHDVIDHVETERDGPAVVDREAQPTGSDTNLVLQPIRVMHTADGLVVVYPADQLAKYRGQLGISPEQDLAQSTDQGTSKPGESLSLLPLASGGHERPARPGSLNQTIARFEHAASLENDRASSASPSASGFGATLPYPAVAALSNPANALHHRNASGSGFSTTSTRGGSPGYGLGHQPASMQNANLLGTPPVAPHWSQTSTGHAIPMQMEGDAYDYSMSWNAPPSTARLHTPPSSMENIRQLSLAQTEAAARMQHDYAAMMEGARQAVYGMENQPAGQPSFTHYFPPGMQTAALQAQQQAFLGQQQHAAHLANRGRPGQPIAPGQGHPSYSGGDRPLPRFASQGPGPRAGRGRFFNQ